MSSRPDRRTFLKSAAAGTAALAATRFGGTDPTPAHPRVHRVHDVPVPDFTASNRHTGVEALLYSLAADGLRFYKSNTLHPLASPAGLIGSNDVVLVKVNAQWKYRGCTNSDVVRGVVQRVLEHPDGFTGEVVIVENGQGRGSLNCDTTSGCDGGSNEVHANAENASNSFSWLCTGLFRDTRVGQRLLDPIRSVAVPAGDHTTQGFRTVASASYPCFLTPKGNRVELREGIWTGSAYDTSRLKLINIPVLKDHKDLNVTGCLKHMYGLFTSYGVTYDFHVPANGGQLMADFWTLVRPPTLNILDCIWVSYASLCGYPASTTTRVDMLVGGPDPCAIDAWAARHILLPISGDPAHDPDIPGLFRTYLTTAVAAINNAGGLSGSLVTMVDSDMRVTHQDARDVQVATLRSGSDIRVMWAGGVAPYTVQRDTSRQFTNPSTRATGLMAGDFTDVAAATGPAYYYRVIGS